MLVLLVLPRFNEVRCFSGQKPRILKRHKKTVAILMPVEPKSTPKKQQAIEETLALAGSWKDLDFDDMIEQLDRIRHQSKPTPPLKLDL